MLGAYMNIFSMFFVAAVNSAWELEDANLKSRMDHIWSMDW